MRGINTRRSAGFSLTEIMVAIFIVAILAAIAIPATLSQRNLGVETAQKSDLLAASAAVEQGLLRWRDAPPSRVDIASGTSQWAAIVAGDEDPAFTGTLSDGTTLTGTIWPDGSYCLQSTVAGSGIVYTFRSDTSEVQTDGTCPTAPFGESILLPGGAEQNLPGLPGNVVATVVNDKNVVVTWAAPSQNATNLTGYTVKLNNIDSVSVAAGVTTVTFPNLTNGNYTVIVYARNAAGVGAGESTTVTVAAEDDMPPHTHPTEQVTGIMPIVGGGTGASTAAGALTALGASALGHAHSLSDVIGGGNLTVPQGGTGAGTFASGSYLKGNGTNAITAQTGVPAADITGTLPIARGGTGATTAAGALTALGAASSGHNHDTSYYTQAQVDAKIAAAGGVNEIYDSQPAGSIIAWSTNTAPAGWLMARGQAVSRSTYSALFAEIGTTYGAGDGSTTFNLPDFSGRTPVGLDSTQTEFNALNGSGGAKTHTLTTAQMPSHTHLQDPHGHVQNAHNHTQDTHNHSQNAHSHTQGLHTHTLGSHSHTQGAHSHGTFGAYMRHNGTATGSINAAGSSGHYWTGVSGTEGATPPALGSATPTISSDAGTVSSVTATNVSTTATNQSTTATNTSTTATNQNTGGGAAFGILSPYRVVNYIIKHTIAQLPSDSQLEPRVATLESRVTTLETNVAPHAHSAADITSGTLPVGRGGTGATTFTAGSYLKGNGTNAFTAQAGVPAADITGTLSIARGGTGATTAAGALTALGVPTTLGALTDVDTTGALNGQVLMYNASLARWALAAGPPRAATDLTDVDTAGAVNGQVLMYNASLGRWTPGAPSVPGVITKSANAPAGATLGDVYYNTSLDDLYVYKPVANREAAAEERGSSATTTQTNITWANVPNAYDEGTATYAAATSSSTTASASLQVSGHPFASTVPSTASLVSVTVDARYLVATAARWTAPTVQAYVGATAIGSPVSLPAATTAAATHRVTLVGVTLAQLRDPQFGVRINVTRASTNNTDTFSVDFLDVTANFLSTQPAWAPVGADSALPQGLIAKAIRTTSLNTTSQVAVDMTGLSTTANVIAGRQYRVTLALPSLLSNVVGDRVIFYVTAGGANIHSALYRAGSVYEQPMTASTIWVPATTGPVTLTARWARDIGTGTVLAYADPVASMELTLEDLGRAL
jgi:prepilin-type N-terminal cleavage/methylation domain-containing protein